MHSFISNCEAALALMNRAQQQLHSLLARQSSPVYIFIPTQCLTVSFLGKFKYTFIESKQCIEDCKLQSNI